MSMKQLPDTHPFKQKGRTPWNKGMRGIGGGRPPITLTCPVCEIKFKKWPAVKYCSRSCYGKGQSGENHPTKRLAVREKISASRLGERNPMWKGGTTHSRNLAMRRLDYRQWRSSVFDRDCWTCVFCGLEDSERIGKGAIIQADHIMPYAFFPELRYEISNGRTLCVPCHKQTKTWGAKSFVLTAET